MFGDLDKYILVFLAGLLVTYLLTPVVRGLAIRFGVVDLPDARRPHKRPTARGGGLALVLGVHAACLTAVLFPWPQLAGAIDFRWWEKFALASSVLLLVGIVDDVRGLKPLVKLGGQVLAAVLIWFSGLRFGQLLGQDLPPPVDCALVVFWLVAIINAFNLIDGLDGLAAGLAIISAVGLTGILVMQHSPAQVLLLLGFIGACLGFLRYNFHPASIFLGDTGSMFLGFTLGVVSLQTFNKNTFLISMTIPIMVLGVPIYDALLAIWRRSLRSRLDKAAGTGRKAGILQPDVEHLHHRLAKSGLSTQSVATFLYVLNGSFVTVGLAILFFHSQAAGIFLIAMLAAVYVLLRQLAVVELRETGRALLTGLRRPTHTTFKALLYPVWDMTVLSASLAFVLWEIEGVDLNFWHHWFLELPIWVTPTFTVLSLSRCYLIYWPRAQFRDFLMLVVCLVTGILVSLGLALIIDSGSRSLWLMRALLVTATAHPLMVSARLLHRSLEELAMWFRIQGDPAGDTERILLYGAGAKARLFLLDHATRIARHSSQRNIVGLIDDELSLHNQWVYGQMVLGGFKELPRLIERHKISRVIVVADLLPENLAGIRELAARHKIKLDQWFLEERDISRRPF